MESINCAHKAHLPSLHEKWGSPRIPMSLILPLSLSPYDHLSDHIPRHKSRALLTAIKSERSGVKRGSGVSNCISMRKPIYIVTVGKGQHWLIKKEQKGDQMATREPCN